MSPNKLIDEIWDLLDEEKLDEAAERAESLASEYPMDAEIQLALAVTRFCLDEPHESRQAAEKAIELSRESEGELDDISRAGRYYLARAAWRLWDFKTAEAILREVLAEEESAEAWDLLACILECTGRAEDAGVADRRAAELDPEGFAVPARFSEVEIESVISEVLAELPEPFQTALDQVPIVLRDFPDARMAAAEDSHSLPFAPDVLGLFVAGVSSGPAVVDSAPQAGTIFLFKGNLERSCADRETLVEEVGVTLFHEIAHFLGFEEEEMSDLGLD